MNITSYLINMYKENYGAHLNDELAEALVYDMAVTDGSDRNDGEKWTLEECKKYGDIMGINWDEVKPCEWYVVMNMNYSDHYATAKKHGLTDPQFYAELSRDFVNDVDGPKNKVFKYFMSA